MSPMHAEEAETPSTSLCNIAAEQEQASNSTLPFDDVGSMSVCLIDICGRNRTPGGYALTSAVFRDIHHSEVVACALELSPSRAWTWLREY